MKYLSRKTRILIGVVFFIFVFFSLTQLFYFDSFTRQLSVSGVGPLFTGQLHENLTSVITRPFTLVTPDHEVIIQPEQLTTWVETYSRAFTGRLEYRVKPTAIENDLQDFTLGLMVPPVSATFGIASGSLVEISPAKPGSELDVNSSVRAITQALINNESRATLILQEVEPALTLEKLLQLGITDRLGQGSSNFGGSPASRIFNINVAAKKMNDILVSPGQTFSFVDYLGEVEAETGYKPELVIKGGKIVPEYGGGVCQVSTTLFRAAMYAGLPIVERRPHSIPVRYYNPQGFDSTVYPGVVDLKFTNNTAAPMLIQSHIKGTVITFDIFGAPDGRVTKLDGPYQYEVNPDGSLKTVLYRTITSGDGTSNKETFHSAYKSPALFQVVKNPLE